MSTQEKLKALLTPAELFEQDTVIFRLPKEVKSFLKKKAEASGTSMGALIRKFIAAGLDSDNSETAQ